MALRAVRCVVAALLMAAGVLVSGCGETAAESESTAAPPGDLPGWRRVLVDDFTGTTLGTGWTPYAGQPAGDPAGWFDAAHLVVKGGVLTIRGSYDATREKWVTGGFSSQHNLVQTYGKYEVRFRAGRGKGISYAILLWPIDNTWPPEIDFAQDNGDDRKRLYATLHAIGGSQVERSKAGDYTGWHTAGLEWTPSRVAYTMDGAVWATTHDAQVPEQPMALALQSQAWYCGHSWQRCPDSSTPSRVDLQVDWIVAYTRRAA